MDSVPSATITGRERGTTGTTGGKRNHTIESIDRLFDDFYADIRRYTT
jgi:hypothetical protein